MARRGCLRGAQFGFERVDQAFDEGRTRIVETASAARVSRLHPGNRLQHAPAPDVMGDAGLGFDELTGGATNLVSCGPGGTLRGEPQKVLKNFKEGYGQSGSFGTLARRSETSEGIAFHSRAL